MQLLGSLASRFSRTVGVGVVVALPFVGLASLAGCQPGALPDCSDDDECKKTYVKASANGGAPAAGKGGMTAAVGMGGMTAPAGMGGMMAAGGAKAPDGGGALGPNLSPVKCAAWKTQAEIEAMLVVPRCGGVGTKAGNCHGGMFFPPSIKAGMLTIMALEKATLTCPGDKHLNKADPAKSSMLTRSKPGAPGCGSSSTKATAMPPEAEKMPLTAAEYDCLTWWAYELAR